MNWKEYAESAHRTANPNLQPLEQLSMGAMGVAGEAGEVCDYLKKVCFHGHMLDKETVKLEIGDVLWYCAYLCTVLGLDMEEVAKANIEKLKMRYPQKFSTEDSVNRTK